MTSSDATQTATQTALEWAGVRYLRDSIA